MMGAVVVAVVAAVAVVVAVVVAAVHHFPLFLILFQYQ